MSSNCKWITYPIRRSSVTFKNSYSLNKKVKSATIYITSMGWYNLYINTYRVDKDVFTPGWTQFTHRVQYQEYDITNVVDSNIDLVVDLGEGWGGGDHFGWTRPGTFLYHQMALIYSIKVTYEDGTNEEFNSDETVSTFTNEIESSDIYGGETQNRFKEMEYLGKALPIDINVDIVPQEGEPIVTGKRFKAKRMFYDNNHDLIIDFGQNFTGYVEVTIKGNKGDKITYTPGEILDKDGNFYNANYRKAKSIFSFVLSGEEDKYVPKFSFLGGRYIKLIDYPDYVNKDNFVGVMVHSKLKRTFEFKSGNKLLNRLFLNVIYGQLSNYLDVPTDCPQRDERLGWTADAQVFASTGAINFNIKKFMRKYLNDMRISQFDNGAIECCIPWPKKSTQDNALVSTGWTDACCVIPYQMYLAYDDKKVIRDNLKMMEKWVDYLSNHYTKKYIPNLAWSWGDWLALDKFQEGPCQGLTRYDLITTAYYAYDLKIIIEARKALHKPTIRYEKLLAKVINAYQKEFIKNGHMVGKKIHMFEPIDTTRTAYSQTGLVLTLYFNLCKEEDRVSLTNDLVELIHECGDVMSTGFIGTPYLLHALSNNGRKDIAYKLLLSTKFPSWLYSVKMGATTIWEHYDGINENGDVWSSEMNSFNHYAYGSVFDWVFSNVVGIKKVLPGYKEVTISPLVDKRLGHTEASFKTKYGKIIVKWKVKEDKTSYDIVVPKGIKANIILENGYTCTLTDGGEIHL